MNTSLRTPRRLWGQNFDCSGGKLKWPKYFFLNPSQSWIWPGLLLPSPLLAMLQLYWPACPRLCSKGLLLLIWLPRFSNPHPPALPCTILPHIPFVWWILTHPLQISIDATSSEKLSLPSPTFMPRLSQDPLLNYLTAACSSSRVLTQLQLNNYLWNYLLRCLFPAEI